MSEQALKLACMYIADTGRCPLGQFDADSVIAVCGCETRCDSGVDVADCWKLWFEKWGVEREMSEYNFGDWVVFDNGYNHKIGRVTECRERSAFVCYHTGCTASCTPFEYLRKATDEEVENARKSQIGYHRFDEFCPSREDEFCQTCVAKAVGK